MNEKPCQAAAASRLVLGAAQIGMPYGINNHRGQPSRSEALEIVLEAWQGGICEFDTAQAYGESEMVLGDIFSELDIGKKVRVITKLNPAVNLKNTTAMESALESSLHRLRVKKLAGFMLHHEDQLDFWSQGLGGWLKKKKEVGLIEEIGISFYTPSKALKALEMDNVQFIQVPANVCDRRFENAGVFNRAAALKKKVYLRSVFLQGLLLAEPETISEKMAFAVPVVEKVQRLAHHLKLSVAELCLGYAIRRWPIAQIVVGAEIKCQVLQNLQMVQRTYPSNLVERVEGELVECGDRFINPNLWPRQ